MSTQAGDRGDGGRQIDDVESVELEFSSFHRFQEEHLRFLSPDGLFIPTHEVLPPSTVVRFRVRLPEDVVLLEGTGVVVWAREVAEKDRPAGMAIRFVALGRQSKDLIDKLVRGYAAQGGVPFDLDRAGDEEDDGHAGRGEEPPPAEEPQSTPRRPREPERIRFTIRGAGGQEDAEARSEARGVAGSETGPVEESDPLATTAPERPISDLLSTSETRQDETVVEPLPEASELELDLPGAEEPVDPDGTVTVPFDAVVGPTNDLASPTSPAWEAADEQTWSGVTPDDGEEPEFGEVAESSWELDEPGVAGQEPEDEAGESDAATDPGRTPAAAPLQPPLDRAEPVEEREPTVDDDLLPPVNLDPEEEAAATPSRSRTDVPPSDQPPPPDEPLYWGAGEGEPDGPGESPRDPDPAAMDVTMPGAGDESARRRWPWVVAALLLVAAAAAVVVWRGPLEEMVAGLLGERSAGPGSLSTTAPGGTESDERGGVDQPPPREVDRVAPDEGAAVAVPSAAPPAVPTALPSPTPAQMVAATAVTDVSWERQGASTVVRVQANGALRPDLVAALPMIDPPRVLLRLRGISEGYPVYTVEAGTAELDRIRIGHHPEQRPPALYVVLDLPGAAVSVDGLDVEGDSVALTLTGP